MKKPKWQTPEEFGAYEVYADGSFDYLDITFYALFVRYEIYEIYLCGIDEEGLHGIDVEEGTTYVIPYELNDIDYCMSIDA